MSQNSYKEEKCCKKCQDWNSNFGRSCANSECKCHHISYTTWKNEEAEKFYLFTDCFRDKIVRDVDAKIADYLISRIKAAREEERLVKLPEHSQAIQAITDAVRYDTLEEIKDIIEGYKSLDFIKKSDLLAVLSAIQEK